MDAEQRRAQKAAYVAKLANQKAAQGSPRIPKLFGKPSPRSEHNQNNNHHQLQPIAASTNSVREQKWEEARQRFNAAKQGKAEPINDAPKVNKFPSFNPPMQQQQQQQQFQQLDFEAAQASQQPNINPRDWKREGAPSEYAYMQANGGLEIKKDSQQQKAQAFVPLQPPPQQQQQQQRQVIPLKLNPAQAKNQQDVNRKAQYAEQLRQDENQRQRERSYSPVRVPHGQQQQQQQQNNNNKNNFFQPPGEDMDIAMKKERQAEYRRELDEQQHNAQNTLLRLRNNIQR